jgi:hypothetical protein
MKPLIAIVFALCTFCNSRAVAHDLLSPPWRGESGTTYQSFAFDTNDNPASPESSANPYGQPSATVNLGFLAVGWMELSWGFGSQLGVWEVGVGGSITLDIPTQGGADLVWLQVTYFEDSLIPAPDINVPGATLLADQTETAVVETTQPFGEWILQKTVWQVQPGFTGEQILLAAGSSTNAMIDQVFVDTRPQTACVVGSDDLAFFCTEWLMSGDLDADLDDSGTVDARDFSILALHWLSECPSGWPY